MIGNSYTLEQFREHFKRIVTIASVAEREGAHSGDCCALDSRLTVDEWFPCDCEMQKALRTLMPDDLELIEVILK